MNKHMINFMALMLAAAIVAGTKGIYSASTSKAADPSTTTTTTSQTANTSTTTTTTSTNADASSNMTPPAMDSSGTNSTPPEKPAVDNNAPDNSMAPGGGNMPGQNNQTSVSYSAVKKISKNTTLKKGTYTSKTADQNAIWTTGNITAKLSNLTVKKTGDSDGGDSTSFYGTNSGILASDGVNLTLNNINVTTNAKGANGVFCYGGSATTNNSTSDGTTVTIINSKITTKADNSGGIMTTGGGTMNAYNLTVKTAGTSSAAIRTDRGGGTVKVNKGTYTTTGKVPLRSLPRPIKH